MDANKVATDGNLWLPGEEARNWWSMVVTGHSCGVIMQTESGLQVWKLFCNSILYYIILYCTIPQCASRIDSNSSEVDSWPALTARFAQSHVLGPQALTWKCFDPDVNRLTF